MSQVTHRNDHLYVCGYKNGHLCVSCVVGHTYEHTFVDGYCSTVQGLLDWFEVDLKFTELLFIQIDLCVMGVVCRRAHV